MALDEDAKKSLVPKDESRTVRGERKRKKPSGVSSKSGRPHPSKYDGFGPRYTDDGTPMVVKENLGWFPGTKVNFPNDIELDPTQVQFLRTPEEQTDEMLRQEMYSQEIPPDDPWLRQRANIWAQLASMPGASPETQWIAKLTAAAAGDVRFNGPAPHSLKNLEKAALGNQGRR